MPRPDSACSESRRAGPARPVPPHHRKTMSLASPPGRVTLADFRQMQALLLETRQQLEDSRDRERVAREELQQRPVLPDPASFPPPPPRAASRAVDSGSAAASHPILPPRASGSLRMPHVPLSCRRPEIVPYFNCPLAAARALAGAAARSAAPRWSRRLRRWAGALAPWPCTPPDPTQRSPGCHLGSAGERH